MTAEQIILDGEPKFKRVIANNSCTIKGKLRKIGNGKIEIAYYQFYIDPLDFNFTIGKKPLPSDQKPMSDEEAQALLQLISKKTKDIYFATYAASVLNDFKEICAHKPFIVEQQTDMSLITGNFTGRTEPLYEPLTRFGNGIFMYKGQLAGNIFYSLIFNNGVFSATKGSGIRNRENKPCSQEEIRFLLKRLIEKYPHNEEGYTNILDQIENYWQQQEKEKQLSQLRNEFRQNPIFFLTNSEIITPFETIAPTIYKSRKGTLYITAKERSEIYHLMADENNPVMEALPLSGNGKTKQMTPTMVSKVLCALSDDIWEEHMEELQKIISQCKNYNGASSNFDVKSALKKDADVLAHSLTLDEIRQKQTDGAYPQTRDTNFQKQLPQRIKKCDTLFTTVMREKFAHHFVNE